MLKKSANRRRSRSGSPMRGADLLVECLRLQGVKHVFGIPGAKVDAVFDALLDKGPELVVCRHEQNAAFMAAAVGRLTGRPGVCLVTSGPGTSNLATGLMTATSEGDPVVALAGAVPRTMRLKQTHQSLDAATLFKAATKYSVEVAHCDNIPEVLSNAFRISSASRPGASFVSLPQDILAEPARVPPLAALPLQNPGPASRASVERAADLINRARMPVVLLGLNASTPGATAGIRRLLGTAPMPVVGTYEASGVISRALLHCFVGRIGLFHNQPGDRLIEASDLIITVGFDPVEYDPCIWNTGENRKIVHVDFRAAEIDRYYFPSAELVGDIESTLDELTGLLSPRKPPSEIRLVRKLQQELDLIKEQGVFKTGRPVHPLRLIHDLRGLIGDDVTVICDVGSIYIWMARYFFAFEPRRLLFSNGQQTLGVALPWAIATTLVRPGQKVVSMSGDGGFLFSAMELETAVRLKSNFVHLVWRDGSYDMVKIQQLAKYGRESGVAFGMPDIVQFARSFGAQGFRIESPEEIVPTLKKALKAEGPVLIDVPIDYKDNHTLCEAMREEVGH